MESIHFSQDLEPSQLVLFIQSFGIPVASMSRLLAALDDAVSTNLPALQEAVLDKSHKAYMAQVIFLHNLNTQKLKNHYHYLSIS